MENLYEFMFFGLKRFECFDLSVCRPQNTRVQLVAPLPVCLFRWAKVYIPALRVFEVFEGQRALMNNNEQPVSIGVFCVAVKTLLATQFASDAVFHISFRGLQVLSLACLVFHGNRRS